MEKTLEVKQLVVLENAYVMLEKHISFLIFLFPQEYSQFIVTTSPCHEPKRVVLHSNVIPTIK